MKAIRMNRSSLAALLGAVVFTLASSVTAAQASPISPANVTAAHGSPISRANAVRMAKSYLSFQAFSRKGLIDQLKYEGFTHAQALYGVRGAGL